MRQYRRMTEFDPSPNAQIKIGVAEPLLIMSYGGCQLI